MKNYDVYALGNALVDMEYEVTTEDLKPPEYRQGRHDPRG
jgi:hypothetical protein